jgi:hypothetical protein
VRAVEIADDANPPAAGVGNDDSARRIDGDAHRSVEPGRVASAVAVTSGRGAAVDHVDPTEHLRRGRIPVEIPYRVAAHIRVDHAIVVERRGREGVAQGLETLHLAIALTVCLRRSKALDGAIGIPAHQTEQIGDEQLGAMRSVDRRHPVRRSPAELRYSADPSVRRDRSHAAGGIGDVQHSLGVEREADRPNERRLRERTVLSADALRRTRERRHHALGRDLSDAMVVRIGYVQRAVMPYNSGWPIEPRFGGGAVAVRAGDPKTFRDQISPPARVRTEPDAPMARMRCAPASLTYSVPSGPYVRPNGMTNDACIESPSANPAAPDPARVRTSTSGFVGIAAAGALPTPNAATMEATSVHRRSTL